jgi:Phosphotransferase enzyme family
MGENVMHDVIEEKHNVLASIEEMLSPETLGALLKRRVAQVNCQRFDSSDSFSGSQLYRVTVDSERLVMKRSYPTRDWSLIATNDYLCRSVRVWQYGLLDRFQLHMDHAILAVCRDKDGYAILMQDVSDGLFRGKEITRSTIYRLLDALAAMHAMFWENADLKGPELGLCTVEQTVKALWPAYCERYRHDARAVEYISSGWAALFELVQSDVRDAMQSLMENPQPLWAKLAQFPSTLIHGDYRLANLAWMPKSNRIVVFDWQHAGYAPAVICLSWFIMTGDVFQMQDTATEYYLNQLSMRLGHKFNPDLWQQMVEVGNMVDVLRKGCWHALFATTSKDEGVRRLLKQSVVTYNDIVRKGLRWL